MLKIKIEQDILVYFIQAETFPDGALAAFQKLHSLIDFPQQRRSFGISRPENGIIVYRAAAEVKEQEDDLKSSELRTLIVPKGDYIGLEIKNFVEDLSSIKKAFDQLILHPQIDPDGYCIEEYKSMHDVICMVRLKNY